MSIASVVQHAGIPTAGLVAGFFGSQVLPMPPNGVEALRHFSVSTALVTALSLYLYGTLKLPATRVAIGVVAGLCMALAASAANASVFTGLAAQGALIGALISMGRADLATTLLFTLSNMALMYGTQQANSPVREAARPVVYSAVLLVGAVVGRFVGARFGLEANSMQALVATTILLSTFTAGVRGEFWKTAGGVGAVAVVALSRSAGTK